MGDAPRAGLRGLCVRSPWGPGRQPARGWCRGLRAGPVGVRMRFSQATHRAPSSFLKLSRVRRPMFEETPTRGKSERLPVDGESSEMLTQSRSLNSEGKAGKMGFK